MTGAQLGVQLVSVVQSQGSNGTTQHTLVACSEGISALERLELQRAADPEDALHPVVMLGPQRSGKRSFLNRLLQPIVGKASFQRQQQQQQQQQQQSQCGLWLIPQLLPVHDPGGGRPAWLLVFCLDIPDDLLQGPGRAAARQLLALAMLLAHTCILNVPQSLGEPESLAFLDILISATERVYSLGLTSGGHPEAPKLVALMRDVMTHGAALLQPDQTWATLWAQELLSLTASTTTSSTSTSRRVSGSGVARQSLGASSTPASGAGALRYKPEQLRDILHRVFPDAEAIPIPRPTPVHQPTLQSLLHQHQHQQQQPQQQQQQHSLQPRLSQQLQSQQQPLPSQTSIPSGSLQQRPSWQAPSLDSFTLPIQPSYQQHAHVPFSGTPTPPISRTSTGSNIACLLDDLPEEELRLGFRKALAIVRSKVLGLDSSTAASGNTHLEAPMSPAVSDVISVDTAAAHKRIGGRLLTVGTLLCVVNAWIKLCGGVTSASLGGRKSSTSSTPCMTRAPSGIPGEDSSSEVQGPPVIPPSPLVIPKSTAHGTSGVPDIPAVTRALVNEECWEAMLWCLEEFKDSMRQAENYWYQPELVVSVYGPAWESIKKEYLDRTLAICEEAAIECLRELRSRCEAHCASLVMRVKEGPKEEKLSTRFRPLGASVAGLAALRRPQSRMSIAPVVSGSLDQLLPPEPPDPFAQRKDDPVTTTRRPLSRAASQTGLPTPPIVPPLPLSALSNAAALSEELSSARESARQSVCGTPGITPRSERRTSRASLAANLLSVDRTQVLESGDLANARPVFAFLPVPPPPDAPPSFRRRNTVSLPLVPSAMSDPQVGVTTDQLLTPHPSRGPPSGSSGQVTPDVSRRNSLTSAGLKGVLSSTDTPVAPVYLQHLRARSVTMSGAAVTGMSSASSWRAFVPPVTADGRQRLSGAFMKRGKGRNDEVMKFDRVSYGGKQGPVTAAQHTGAAAPDTGKSVFARASAPIGKPQEAGGGEEVKAQVKEGEEEGEEEFRFPGSERLTSLVAAWDHRAGRISAALTDALDRLRATAA